jgi:hypothetical protein
MRVEFIIFRTFLDRPFEFGWDKELYTVSSGGID